MNSKRVGFLVVVILFIVLFFLNKKEIMLVNQSDVTLKNIAATGVELSSVIHLHNPNLLSITVNKMQEKYVINGLQVGELEVQIDQGIPGRKETEFPVSIRLSKEDYNKALLKDTSNPNLTLVIDGKIDYSNFTGNKTLSVHQVVELPH